MTLASPRSSSVSWVESAASLARSNPRASRSGFSSSKSQRARRARAAVAAWYALTICDEVTIALAPGCPGTAMPYSVSVPITRSTLIVVQRSASWQYRGRARPGSSSQILTGVSDGVDGTAGLGALLARDQGPDVNDALALLAGDPGPVVRIRGVRQVLVLAELVHAGGQQVGDPDALLLRLEVFLDRHLLGAGHDVLDHGAGVEVLEVQDFLVAVGVSDLEEAVLLGLAVHPLDDALDHPLHRGLPRVGVLGQVVRVQRQFGQHVLGEDVLSRLGVRPLDLDLDVQAAWPQDRRVDHVLTVGGADDDDVLQAFHAVDLAQQLRHDRVLHVARDAGTTGAEDRVHLVEEHDDRHALAGLLAGSLEDEPDVPLGLADVLVQQLGALDVEEEALPLLLLAIAWGAFGRRLRGLGRDLLGEGVRHRLGDERLAATGRAVEQDALGRPQLVLAEQVRVQVRQLDGVADLLDLRRQAADVLVGDVRDFFEDELLDLGLRDPLVDVAGPRLEQQRVAAAQRLGQQRLGEPDHPLLVRVRDDQGALAVGEQFLEHHDLADGLITLGDDDVQRLVEHDLLAGPQLFELDIRADVHPHLPPAGEYVRRAVLARGEEHAEPRRRLRQPVDLFLQRDDLVPGLAQRRRQPLVLGGDRRQARLCLAEPFLKQADLAWRIRE